MLVLSTFYFLLSTVSWASVSPDPAALAGCGRGLRAAFAEELAASPHCSTADASIQEPSRERPAEPPHGASAHSGSETVWPLFPPGWPSPAVVVLIELSQQAWWLIPIRNPKPRCCLNCILTNRRSRQLMKRKGCGKDTSGKSNDFLHGL